MKKLILISIILSISLILYACTACDSDKPDTVANRKGFERHFSFPAPFGVTNLYYFTDEIGIDVKYQIGFKAPKHIIEKIITELNLVQKKAVDPSSLAQDFDWWDKEIIVQLIPYWKSSPDNDYFLFLWYDSKSQRAYYLEFSL